jgi:hypothetical protein
MKTSKSKLTHKLAALATTAMMMYSTGASAAAAAAPPAAAGSVDANTLVGNLTTSSAGLTTLLGLLGYVGGSGFAVAGIYKLKMHVDNPGQTPMKDGVMRLAAGGGLLSLPFMVATMQGSVGEGNANTAQSALYKVSSFQ